MERTNKRRSMILMALCACMWSTAGIFIKEISWNPLAIAGFRSIFSAIVLSVYMAVSGLHFHISKWSLIAGAGLTSCFLCFVSANKYTTAANAIVLQYMAPVFILIISAIFLKKKLKKNDITVVLISSCGIILFFIDKISPGNIFGNLLGILAGLSFAVMFVATGQSQDDDSVRMSGILIAHLLTAAVGVAVAVISPFHTSGKEIVFIVLLGIIQLGIPYVLYAIAAKYCSPLACSLIGMLEPMLNPVWVFLFYGERPGYFALAGGVIIIVSTSVWCIKESKN